MTDQELLRAYLNKQDDAFAQLVQRHLPLVYHAARRLVGPSNAEDITQAVFALLASKAPELTARITLAGWLYEATRYCCNNFYKSDQRRRKYEAEVAMQKDPSSSASESQIDLRDTLDAALARLNTREREAVLLRYMENRSIEETAVALAIAPKAAAKRASRALEKLRVILSAKNVTIPAAGLAVLLAAETSQAVPAAVAATAIAAPAAASTLGNGFTFSAWSTQSIVSMATIKIAACIVAVMGLTIGAIVVIPHLTASTTTGTAAVPPVLAAPKALPAEPLPTLAAGPGAGIHLANFGVILREDDAMRLRAAGTVENTASKKFTAYRMPAEKLRQQLKELRRAGRLDSASSQVNLTPGDGYYLSSLSWYETAVDSNLLADHVLQCYWQSIGGTVKAATIDQQPRLHAAYSCEIPPGNGVLRARNARTPRTEITGKIDFDVTLADGDALVCISDTVRFAPLAVNIVAVFEAVTANSMELDPVRSLAATHPRLWEEQGAPAMRWLAARALVWEAAAGQKFGDPAGSSWERRIAPEVTARVLAVARSDTYDLCSWDPNGTPLFGVYPAYVSAPAANQLIVIVEVTDTSLQPVDPASLLEFFRADIWRNHFNSREIGFNRDKHRVYVSVLTDPANPRVELGIGYGEGECVGEIQQHNEKQWVGNVELLCRHIFEEDRDVDIFCEFSQGDDDDQEYYYVLVMNNGNVLPLTGAPQPVVRQNAEMDRQVGIGARAQKKWRDVKRVELWQRPRKWVTWTGVATQPNRAIPQIITEEDITAARKIAEVRDIAAKYPVIPEIAPDLSTPLGSLAHMRAAARRGDYQTVRAGFYATDEQEKRSADLRAERIVAAEQMLVDAEKLFPQPDCRIHLDFKNAYTLSSELRKTWRIAGDTAVPEDFLWDQMVRRDGRWMIDFRSQEHGGIIPQDSMDVLKSRIHDAQAIRMMHEEIKAGVYTTAQEASKSIVRHLAELREAKNAGKAAEDSSSATQHAR